MNPAFWGLVIIVLIVVWFLMSFSFKSVANSLEIYGEI